MESSGGLTSDFVSVCFGCLCVCVCLCVCDAQWCTIYDATHAIRIKESMPTACDIWYSAYMCLLWFSKKNRPGNSLETTERSSAVGSKKPISVDDFFIFWVVAYLRKISCGSSAESTWLWLSVVWCCFFRVGLNNSMVAAIGFALRSCEAVAFVSPATTLELVLSLERRSQLLSTWLFHVVSTWWTTSIHLIWLHGWWFPPLWTILVQPANHLSYWGK